jgi:hypothetical protein
VHIGAVSFKPWSLELALSDVRIAGQAGAPDLLKIRRIYADAELQSLFRLAPVVDAIRVEAPEIRLTHLGGGHYDIDDILARLAARPQPATPPEPARFALYNIALTEGRIDFDDRTVGRVHEVRDLRLLLPFISNLPSQRQVQVQPELAFVANGSHFDSRAQTLPFEASRQTGAVLRLAGFNLQPYLGYLPASLPLRLQAATVDADLRLGFVQAPQPALRLGGTLAISGLKSVDAQGADALGFDTLKLALGDVRPLERRLHLASVELSGPRLVLRRLADGRFNLLAPPAVATESGAARALPERAGSQNNAQAAAPAASAASAASVAAPAAAAATPAPAWQLAIDKLAVHGGTVDFTDDSTASAQAPAAVVRLNEVELDADTLAWPLAQALHFKGSAALVGTEGLTPAIPADAAPRSAARARAAASATPSVALAKPAAAPAAKATAQAAAAPRERVPSIEFQGQAGPAGAQVNARVADVPLALAAPYAAPYLAPRLSGALHAHVGLQWAPPKARDLPPELKIAAERLALTQLMLTDAPASAPTAASSGSSAAAPAAASVVAPAARPARAGDRRRAPAGPLASIAQVELQQVLLDWRTRAVSVGQLGVQAPRLAVARDADQRWMFQDWLRAPAEAAAPARAASAPAPAADVPWKLQLGQLTVDGGQIGWRDAAVADGPVDVELTQLQIDGRQLSLDSKQPMPVNLSARLGSGRGEPGRLAWRGSLGLAPLSAQGSVEAERLPVHAFEPYFGEQLNIDILRADASFKGDVGFTQTAQGPRVRLRGDASLQELRTHSRPGSAVAVDEPAPSATAATSSTSTSRAGAGGATPATALAAAPAPRALGAATPKPLATTAAGASQAPLAPMAAPAGRTSASLGEELLSWKLLRLSGLDVQLEPGKPAQVDVKDTLLSDFYARILIHPSGRINLQDVVKSAAASAPAPASGAASAASNSIAASAPAAGAAAQKPAQADPMAPVIRFGPVRLAGGKVFFSDRFIRPNYSADLSELAGSLGAFSSVAPAGAPQMAELNLTGRAEGSAALQVGGRLNPLAKPLALDVQAKVTDLELPPLTPYAVKYAGHGIERGKLSMDVAYKVEPDGRLTASNRLVLNQLEFSEPVAGAPASLPVKLATALLSDSHGVIDLDLPISGSLNDPQFSLGPVIFKAIGNLIAKALTAPFSLLARALGGDGGQDMSQVAFAPGSARLDGKAREQLDKVAKVLADRPQLKLTVVGTARLDDERDGFRRERLKALVAAEQRGDGASAAAAPAASATAPGQAASAAPASPAAAPVSVAASAPPAGAAAQKDTNSADPGYAQALRRLYRRADVPGKPRNAIGLLRDIPVPEMEALLLAHIDVGDDAMRQLAVQRGVAVKDYLAGKQLPPERLFLGAARTGSAAAAPAAASASAPASAPASGSGWSPRAELALAAR